VFFADSSGMASHTLTTSVPQSIAIGTASSVTNWTFDAIALNSNPATGSFNADTTSYDSLGRYNIIHNTCNGCPAIGGTAGNALEEYRGFHNISFDKSYKAEIITSVASIGVDTFGVCVGDYAAFESSIFGDSIFWNFNGAITNPGNELTLTAQFNIPGFYPIELYIRTDCCGDSPIDTVYLYVSPTPNVTAGGNQTICIGNSAPLTVLGLSPNDTILWSPTSDLIVLSKDSVMVSPDSNTTYYASVYSVVTVGTKSILSCPVNLSFTVTVNSLPTTVLTSTNVVCNSNGSVTASPIAGIYDFTWSNGFTESAVSSSTMINSPVGEYCVTITDVVTGCIDSDCVCIGFDSVAPVVFVSNNTPVSCWGDTDGCATIGTFSGLAPYTYVWDTIMTGYPSSTDSNFTICNLSPRDYSVTSTDMNGCVSVVNFNIPEPNPVNYHLHDSINPSCVGSLDGKIEIEAVGGTGGLNYIWSTGDTIGELEDLDEGTYCVTVVDDNNCAVSTCIVFTYQQTVTISSLNIISPIYCAGSGACILTNVSGGSGTYSYNWTGDSPFSPFSTGIAAACGFPATAGYYNLSVIDSVYGCVETDSILIAGPTAVSATLVGLSNINCYGDSTGYISLTASGGTELGAYDYLWNSGQITAIITGLEAGVYCVTITDDNGCTFDTCFNLSQPLNPLIISGTVVSDYNGTQVSCNGSSDAFIVINTSGGSGNSNAFTYDWGGVFPNTDSIGGLFAGVYYITVTDTLGCVVMDSIFIVEPAIFTALMDSSSLITINCKGDSTGGISVLGSGGVSSYSYDWSNGQTTAIGNNLAAGTHCVTLTDLNGCNAYSCFTLVEPLQNLTIAASVNSNYNGQAISCHASCDAEILATAVGGTVGTSYTFQWSANAGGQTSSLATGLCAGLYTVIAYDTVGCMDSTSVQIIEPSPLAISISSVTNVLCEGNCDGLATVAGLGGTSGYTFSWSTGQTTGTATGLCANNYRITVSDMNACLAIDSLSITAPSLLTVSVVGNANGTATASGIGGTFPYAFLWDAAASNQTTATATGLTNGMYVVTITDAHGCLDTASVNITGVGLENLDNEDKLRVFPNPTSSDVFIEFNLIESKSVNIRILDAIGQVVLEKDLGEIKNNRIKLKTRQFAAGVYMLQFSIGLESISKKLIIE